MMISEIEQEGQDQEDTVKEHMMMTTKSMEFQYNSEHETTL